MLIGLYPTNINARSNSLEAAGRRERLARLEQFVEIA
jgi:hypothetical protein